MNLKILKFIFFDKADKIYKIKNENQYLELTNLPLPVRIRSFA